MSCHLHYKQSNRKRSLILGAALVVLFLAVALDLCVGTSEVSLRGLLSAFSEGPNAQSIEGAILWQLRLPMTLTAMFVGTSLGLAGLQIQNITQNPLASPSTLGITSAASFGAALSISLGLTALGHLWIATAANALIFALVVSFAIYFLSVKRSMTPETVILAGIVVNFFFLALQQVLIYRSSPEVAQIINGWTFGNLERSSWLAAGLSMILTMLCALFLLKRSWSLTALTLGEERAMSLGVPVKRLRVETFFLSALLISGAVAFVGIISFVGLVAPHIAKLLLGEDQRFLLPGTLLSGALLMVLSSLVAKLLSTGAVMPVGIITSLVGVPFLLLLLVRHSARRAA